MNDETQIRCSKSCSATCAKPWVRLHWVQARPAWTAASASGCRPSALPTSPDYEDYLEVHPDEFVHAVQHHPDQRHRASFATRPVWEYLGERRCPADPRGQAGRRADPGLEAGCALRARRRTPWPSFWPRPWAGGVSRARQDLRHRHRQRGPEPGPAGRVHAQGPGGGAARPAAEVLRDRRRPPAVPQGPAPQRHLRPARPDPGRPDLAARPAWSAGTA